MTKKSCFDFCSADGRYKREKGVNEVESTGRKHFMCFFWTLCFLIWLTIGIIYLDRI